MEQEMIGNSILFIAAGNDTSATSMTFLVYELALAPEILDRLVAEIAEVLPDKVRNMIWTSASVMQLSNCPNN